MISFGLGIPPSANSESDPIALAVAAERLGFDFVSMSDHPGGTSPSFETWTLLTYIAARTHRIRIATRVLGVPYRAPAMVAKMAETLDRLSSGRLILGLGGGSSDEEHAAFGLGVRTPGEKVTGLTEAVTIIRGLWSEHELTFAGRLYQTRAAQISPKPERDIPIWLGTFGPRALKLTGRLADGWIPTLGYVSGEQLRSMRQVVLDAAVGAGRDPEALTCALHLTVRVDDTASPADDPDDLEGPAEVIVERLRAFRDGGFSAFNFAVSGPDAVEQAERLAADVLPGLRD